MESSSRTVTAVVNKRKHIMHSSLFVVNEFSLFFHNRRFETPGTKKNVTNRVSNWAQDIPAPPKTLPTKRTSTKSLVIPKASSNVVKITPSLASSRPNSCAIVSTSTTDILNKPARKAKRQAEELESVGDGYDEVSSAAFGGLDEDEDDSLEQVAAAMSPLKASVAMQRSKVSSSQFMKV